MPHSESSQERQAKLETLEERIVLSAQPLSDFTLDDFITQQLEQPYTDVATTELSTFVSDGDHFTGLSQVVEEYELTGEGQTVAVIDTGIAWDHYALGGGFGAGHQVVGGWDFAENDANPYDDGPAGFHGTHVAGIIGSNDADHLGVAPDADLVALRVFDDSGNASFNWVEDALQWVHDHQHEFENPITTVNLSLGANWNSDSVPNWAMLEDEFAQLKQDGIFISVAAGNSFSEYGTSGLSYPASSPLVVPVASVGDDGQISDFSQRNQRVVAAPGESIESTVPNHLFGSNAPSDQFMALSGTSMAAPYMAGASVLLREAMISAGITEIDQDMLYEHFRETADEIWDSTTNAHYLRLNIANAIENVMGDQVGNTISDADNLGTIGNGAEISGRIHATSDIDVYAFEVQKSGTIRFDVSTNEALDSRIRVFGHTGWETDGIVTLRVEPGETYYLAIGSAGGSGSFNVTASLQPDYSQTTENWGIVDKHQQEGVAIDQDWGARIKANLTGKFSLVAHYESGYGDVNFSLFDSQGRELATGNEFGGGERLNANVEEGKVYYLKASGANSHVDLQAINLVSIDSNGQVTAVGTDSADRFTVQFQNQLVVGVDGIWYRFSMSDVSGVNVSGNGGQDELQLVGDSSREVGRVKGDFVVWKNDHVKLVGRSLENISVDASGGHDLLKLQGSQGQDSLTAQKDRIEFSGLGFSHQFTGIEHLNASANDSLDRVHFLDSAGNDRILANASGSLFGGQGYRFVANGFSSVEVTKQLGGYDTGFIKGSSSSDQFMGTVGETRMESQGIEVRVNSFDRVKLYGYGGVDSFVGTASLGNAAWVQRDSFEFIRGDGFRYDLLDVELASISTESSIQALSQSLQAESVSTTQGPNNESLMDLESRALQFQYGPETSYQNNRFELRSNSQQAATYQTTGHQASNQQASNQQEVVLTRIAYGPVDQLFGGQAKTEFLNTNESLDHPQAHVGSKVADLSKLNDEVANYLQERAAGSDLNIPKVDGEQADMLFSGELQFEFQDIAEGQDRVEAQRMIDSETDRLLNCLESFESEHSQVDKLFESLAMEEASDQGSDTEGKN